MNKIYNIESHLETRIAFLTFLLTLLIAVTLVFIFGLPYYFLHYSSFFDSVINFIPKAYSIGWLPVFILFFIGLRKGIITSKRLLISLSFIAALLAFIYRLPDCSVFDCEFLPVSSIIYFIILLFFWSVFYFILFILNRNLSVRNFFSIHSPSISYCFIGLFLIIIIINSSRDLINSFWIQNFYVFVDRCDLATNSKIVRNCIDKFRSNKSSKDCLIFKDPKSQFSCLAEIVPAESTVAIDTNNEGKCMQLITDIPGFQSYQSNLPYSQFVPDKVRCIATIAINKNNSEICQLLSDPLLISACQQIYNFANEKNPKKQCILTDIIDVPWCLNFVDYKNKSK